ncbi:MAG: long-chain fatty acid--CoA ligase [Nitrospirae bacterium]|nr:MAG: long-chain fatty acid--CoA ligase [Nitrospirota bacterium]
MTSDQLFARFRSYRNHEALIIGDQSYTYSDLDYCLNQWIARLSPLFHNVGTPVVGLQSDYSLESVACLFAVWSLKGTAALIPPSPTNTSQILADAQVNLLFRQTSDTSWTLDPIGHNVSHPLLRQLAKDKIPGLILFTSGSSGHPKAVLHHVDRFLSKFDTPKPPYRTLAFLLFDHVAGIDTLLSVFSNGGTLIVPATRHPTSICQLIEHHRIEVLPTSPTFLRLLCMANVASQFDLSSLKIIAYGSEPMTPSTLAAVRTQFPQVRLIQKYGSTEFGSPPSSTKQDDGLWIKLDDNSVRFKIIDQMLWIKTDTAMMGYLNAPDPRVQDGWFPTGDEVVIEGEWLRILGRKSDIIS